MDVREAINKAKLYLADVLADEKASQIRLEEVEFDEANDAWLITLGVMRPVFGSLGTVLEIDPPLKRSYKIVSIPNDEKKPPSIKIRVFDETN